ncbi:MAG: hypothetical protein HN707_03050 [Verrucomicrobia bacterium]|jgi:hypothetical protein|nr:hypothetical protein [Verrucomicrobiota bacterium]MBT6103624.1 hypothetical protein [Verrucomicrobiota bacterium]MBT7733862.1 hypothetical protein [Verrucomicrobiota bacterium]
MKKLILLFVVLPFMTSPLAAVADELDTPAVAKPGEMIVEVNGVVCSICAKGLKKNLAKLDFQSPVLTEKSGVKIDIRSGRLVIHRDPAKPIDFGAIRTAVKRGGYDLEKLYLYLTGSLEEANGQWVLAEKAGRHKFALAKAPDGLADGNAVTARVVINAKSVAKAKPGAAVAVEVDEISGTNQ